jgi:ABC-type Zn uptake system ZnuABC Zn-binding protein ZnuA
VLHAAVVASSCVAIGGCGRQAFDATSVGCALGDHNETGGLRLVASVSPITDIVAAITAGTPATVTGIVPEGADGHTFAPTPDVARRLEDADVVFLNGLGLEQSTLALAIDTMSSHATLCELGSEVLPVDDYRFDTTFPAADGRPNPHLWTSPPYAIAYARLVSDVLARRDPPNAATYRANRDRYVADLDRLDAAMRVATASLPAERRVLVTYHDAFAYMADHYGFTVVAAVQPASFSEPTPGEVAALIDEIERLHVPVVFGSEVFPSPILHRIADESGARYVDDLGDDDLPGDPGDRDHSLPSLLRFDFVTIIDALGGDASALRALDSG